MDQVFAFLLSKIFLSKLIGDSSRKAGKEYGTALKANFACGLASRSMIGVSELKARDEGNLLNVQ